MATALPDLLGALRQPEYTGENRCIPCTVVNAVIAVVLAVGVGVAAGVALRPAAGFALASAALTFSAAAIYLRGYLVPGTPRLTKRYFPDWVLRRFDKVPAADDAPPADVDAEELLVRFGAVTECEHEDDLCLTDDFRAAWRDRIARVRGADTDREELASILDADPDRLSFRELSADAFVARLDGTRVGQWESRAAFLADVAAAAELESRGPDWANLDVARQSQLLNGLRIFLERCPACDGSVSLGEDVVESCCRSIDVVAVTCDDCGARLFEAEHPG